MNTDIPACRPTDGKPVVGTVTGTLGLNTSVNAPLRRNILSIQSSPALCSCLLSESWPQWGSWSLTLHISLSFSHPLPLLTILSAFLAPLSSLLIYRIMHQTSSRGDSVMQAAAPSALMLLLTTVCEPLALEKKRTNTHQGGISTWTTKTVNPPHAL